VAERRHKDAGVEGAKQVVRAVVDEQVDGDLAAARDLVVAAPEVVLAQADVGQPAPRGGQRPLGAMAEDVNRVPRGIPAVDDLDRVPVGARAGDRLIGVRVLDAHAQLLFAETAAGPRDLLLVGQLDAEAALGRGREQRPVMVQGRIDVDGDAHGQSSRFS